MPFFTRSKSRLRLSLIVCATLVLVFSLLSLSLRKSAALRQLESVAVSVTAPGFKALSAGGQSLKRLWFGYLYLVGVQKENETLRRRLAEAVQREARYQEALLALNRLEALLDLKRQLALPVIGARVVAYDPSLWSRAAIIDQGRSEGVEVGQAVVAPAGIVGRIVETYPHYAKVMLIVDRNSGADAMIQRTRVRGILEGKGGNRCSLEFVPKNADVQEGDLVLASGLGGIYPQGLVFGKVTSADKKTAGVFQKIEVNPTVDLSSLEEVLVVKTAKLALSP
jgi:rod shape-determining protein MreC|uniref:Cell shape-determining protein MreC n=1 Tax=Desulfobacca acetoxidans TaxID=60893 RepID=A0A7C3WSV2_9BACT